jgi:hypothetical protein
MITARLRLAADDAPAWIVSFGKSEQRIRIVTL